MASLLILEELSAGYGEATVISGVSFALAEGSALALLGRNGMGKTTLINTIVGLTDQVSGRIVLAGRELGGLRPDLRALAGVGWVPQQRNIFASLTVEENLAAVARPGAFTPARIFALFPRLAERRRQPGGQLSGGEQQMLAIGRALVLNPRLLLLDEPLEGLAPIIAQELIGELRALIGTQGMAAIVVEQNVRQVLGMTEQAIILERGKLVYQGASGSLLADPERLGTYLGVGARADLPRPGGAPRLTPP